MFLFLSMSRKFPSVSFVDGLECVDYIVLDSWISGSKLIDDFFRPRSFGLQRKGADVGKNREFQPRDFLQDSPLFYQDERADDRDAGAALPEFRLKRLESAGVEEIHKCSFDGVVQVVTQSEHITPGLVHRRVQNSSADVRAQAAR